MPVQRGNTRQIREEKYNDDTLLAIFPSLPFLSFTFQPVSQTYNTEVLVQRRNVALCNI